MPCTLTYRNSLFFCFLMAPNMFHDLFGLDLPVKERKTLERQQKEREELLLPIYQQVILEFAWENSVPLDSLNLRLFESRLHGKLNVMIKLKCSAGLF